MQVDQLVLVRFLGGGTFFTILSGERLGRSVVIFVFGPPVVVDEGLEIVHFDYVAALFFVLDEGGVLLVLLSLV